MKTILTLLTVTLSLLLFGQELNAQTLPPKAADEIYVIVPPGTCDAAIAMIEVGTYKPAKGEFWTRSPRKFVNVCELFVDKIFVARYRLAVRCVDRVTKGARSAWVRSLSGLGKAWPTTCPGFDPGNPINPTIP